MPKKLTFDYAGPANGLDQPGLPLFGYSPALNESLDLKPLSSRLYLVPTPITFEGEDVEPDVQYKPSALKDLPDLEEWVSRYLVSLLEIWAGKRGAMQLARWTHPRTFEAVTGSIKAKSATPKIRKIYISEPIEGVGEVTVTLRYDDRVRSLAMRFEGVDKRWLCTELVKI